MMQGTPRSLDLGGDPAAMSGPPSLKSEVSQLGVLDFISLPAVTSHHFTS